MQLSVKHVQDAVFREFKAESAREGLPVGKALTLAMKLWIEQREKKPRLRFLTFPVRDWGEGSERTSEEIDHTLY